MNRPKHQPNALEQWLTDPRSAVYFGRGFLIRAEVLHHLLTGDGSLADIARAHCVTRQAVHRHAQRARKLYSFGKPVVDFARMTK